MEPVKDIYKYTIHKESFIILKLYSLYFSKFEFLFIIFRNNDKYSFFELSYTLFLYTKIIDKI